MSVTMMEQYMDEDRHWTMKALAEHIDFWVYIAALFPVTLKIYKIAAKWV